MKNKKIIIIVLFLIAVLAGVAFVAGNKLSKDEPTTNDSSSLLETETKTKPENIMLPEEVTWNGVFHDAF